ncbi:hypothetical protein EGK75_08330 [Neisseria weixii]|uniref:Uncharacterized protein n=1 Tax=Neisseria weixii TaxID=1853276 RepID=A0A3N4MSA5_9NEIS|nr:hypothetical protein [Neisseria weixii]RPD86138.1 hypothetical protein EGK74_08585 [Neisseria weixii]RPD86871.1 hypothetical protein EGK75_08330 [Neisseria weixii]
MKLLAYTTQDGFETVTPLSAKSRNLAVIYSRHAPGCRLEMYVNRRGSNHFFAYKGERCSDGITEPESLTHTLCKTVLKELADEGLSTELKLTHKGRRWDYPVPVILTSGAFEYPIQANGHQYFIDTFCTFRQENISFLKSYACKWGGQIAFEFFHTSGLAANSPKCRDLERMGIPVIQVAAREGDFLYLDEDTLIGKTDQEAMEQIELHRQKIRNAFKKQIIGVLFNSPVSEAYEAAQELYGSLETALQRIKDLEQENQALVAGTELLSDKVKQLTLEQEHYLYRIGEMAQKTASEQASVQPAQEVPKPMGLWATLRRIFK